MLRVATPNRRTANTEKSPEFFTLFGGQCRFQLCLFLLPHINRKLNKTQIIYYKWVTFYAKWNMPHGFQSSSIKVGIANRIGIQSSNQTPENFALSHIGKKRGINTILIDMNIHRRVHTSQTVQWTLHISRAYIRSLTISQHNCGGKGRKA